MTLNSKEVDLKKYIEFVYGVTSAPSTDYAALMARLTALETDNADKCKISVYYKNMTLPTIYSL